VLISEMIRYSCRCCPTSWVCRYCCLPPFTCDAMNRVMEPRTVSALELEMFTLTDTLRAATSEYYSIGMTSSVNRQSN